MYTIAEIQTMLESRQFDISQLPKEISPELFQTIETMFEKRYGIDSLTFIQTMTLPIPEDIAFLWDKIWYNHLTSPQDKWIDVL